MKRKYLTVIHGDNDLFTIGMLICCAWGKLSWKWFWFVFILNEVHALSVRYLEKKGK